MSRFVKVMVALLLVAFIAVLFFFGSFFQFLSGFRSTASGYPMQEKKPHLTMLRVEGPIMSSEPFMSSIKRISENNACKGVLVRVDSPGGAVGASQEIFTALNDLKKKKIPIIVSYGNVAASGGYYISLAGDRIFSNPGTLTGSIGVIFQYPIAKDLFNKIGVEMVTVKSGDLKDLGNTFRETSPRELAYLKTLIQEIYGQFVQDILKSRKIEKDRLLKVADGRIMTGSQAQAEGLIDTLGSLQDAKAFLEATSNIGPNPIYVEEPPEESWFQTLLESSFPGVFQAADKVAPMVRQGAFYIWN